MFTESDLRIEALARATTIPSAWYTDPRFHSFDREVIFARTWQAVGHTGDLQERGSHCIATVADEPILILRDDDGVIRAFHNVCRHRGGPLAYEKGCSAMIQCKYHGWTYRLDGTLRGVPRFDRVDLFDKRDFGLVPIRCEVWEGFVFINLNADEPLPLARIVEGITERIAPMRLDTKRFHSRVEYDVACNWKVYVDNYLEGYHVPLVHPGLFSLLDYREYLTETFDYYSLQYSPLRPGVSIYSQDGGDAYYYFIHPNFMLNILPGRLQTNLVIPTSHDRCRVIFDYYYDDGVSEATVAEDLVSSDTTQGEDISICEHVQRGLNSRAYDRGRFSVELEGGVHHFQNLIREAYRRGSDSPR